MQSGFDPPPPPGGNPPPGSSAPSFGEQATQLQPAIEQPPQQQPALMPEVQAPQQQPPYPPPQASYPQPQGYTPPPGYAQPYAQNAYPQNPYPQNNPYGQQQFMPPPNYVQPAPGYVGGYGGYGYAIPTDGKATASLVLAIVSFFCMGPFTGIPAIVLGFLARRDINRSGGTLSGAGMALAGIIIGGLNLVLYGVYAIFMIVAFTTAAKSASGIPTSYPTSPFVIPTPPPTATATGGAVASTTFHGTIKVVSLATGRSLQDQLIDLRTSELASGRIPIVETTATWCVACKEIASTIDDPLLQRALTNVTLVMVDTDDFGPELADLKMGSDAIPFFYKIDSTAHATDAISGDEWDANTPANEAPVLGAFAKGTLKKRRHPSSVGTSL